MRTQETYVTEARGRSAPKRRRGISFDFRLFAIFFFGWIAVGPTPNTSGIENLLGGMLIVLALFIGLSIHHRRELGRQWPGVRVENAVAQIIFLLWFGALLTWMFMSLAGRALTPPGLGACKSGAIRG
jgi:hypothetical protein